MIASDCSSSGLGVENAHGAAHPQRRAAWLNRRPLAYQSAPGLPHERPPTSRGLLQDRRPQFNKSTVVFVFPSTNGLRNERRQGASAHQSGQLWSLGFIPWLRSRWLAWHESKGVGMCVCPRRLSSRRPYPSDAPFLLQHPDGAVQPGGAGQGLLGQSVLVSETSVLLLCACAPCVRLLALSGFDVALLCFGGHAPLCTLTHAPPLPWRSPPAPRRPCPRRCLPALLRRHADYADSAYIYVGGLGLSSFHPGAMLHECAPSQTTHSKGSPPSVPAHARARPRHPLCARHPTADRRAAHGGRCYNHLLAGEHSSVGLFCGE